MIRISNISLSIDAGMEQLKKQAAQLLGVPVQELGELAIVRQSIDARNKGDVHYVYTVELTMAEEEGVVSRAPGKNITLIQHQPYVFPEGKRASPVAPVVVGMGPAGLFAALFLARNGQICTVLERGQDVDTRTKDVEDFWSGKGLKPSSNVQFGEGGAGTFSDGKLTTLTHDARITAVMDTLVGAGAPEDIKSSQKPHIGTDILRQVVKNIRQELIALGCDIRFGHQLTGLECAGEQLKSVSVEGPQGAYTLPCDALVLAPGHSARDTFVMLRDAGIPMEQKGFAIGVRLEHSQEKISRQQYGPAYNKLAPADYKLACHLPNGRSAFTFCVCPGGSVVAAASEEGCVVTNGMSLRARDGKNSNGGLLVGVGPEDFGSSDVLAGVQFQQQWERAAYALGGGDYTAPVQRVEDFLKARPSKGPGSVLPSYRPGVKWTALDSCLPAGIIDTLRQSIPLLNRKLHGFADPDCVMVGVETRSSSPVRILRDAQCQSTVRGLFPCGEGAGYAGGIVSAAVDGIRVAEAIARG